jgi:hypothetical protein
MTRLSLLGVFLGLLLALPCIWHGQRQVNHEARLLLVPEVIPQAVR